MCIYIYITFISIFIFIFICIYIYSYTYMCVYVHISICLYVYMCICVYVYVWSVWTNIRRLCMRISVCACPIACGNSLRKWHARPINFGFETAWASLIVAEDIDSELRTDLFEPGDLKRCLRHNACSNPLRTKQQTNKATTRNPQNAQKI